MLIFSIAKELEMSMTVPAALPQILLFCGGLAAVVVVQVLMHFMIQRLDSSLVVLYNVYSNPQAMLKKTSLIIAVTYLILTLIFGGRVLFLVTMVLLIIAIAFIWFGEEIRDYTGGCHRIGRSCITKKSPGAFMSLFGSLLRALPMILILLKLIQKK
jgi:hypothetical protein